MINEDELEQAIKEATKKKIRCRKCSWLNYNFFSKNYEPYKDGYFCGLHGRETIDPDGEQKNLDRRGGCGFSPKIKPPKQLSLFEF